MSTKSNNDRTNAEVLANAKRGRGRVVEVKLDRAAREVMERSSWTYAHMCRDGHQEIGHNDSEHEMCPLCRALALAERARDKALEEAAKLRCVFCRETTSKAVVLDGIWVHYSTAPVPTPCEAGDIRALASEPGRETK